MLIQNITTMHLLFVFITFRISDVSAVSSPAAVPTPVGVRSAPAPAAVTPPATALRPGFLLVRPSVRSTAAAPITSNAIVPTAVLTPSGFPPPPPAPAAVPYAGVPAVVPAADGSVILGPCKIAGRQGSTGHNRSTQPPAKCKALQCYRAGGRCVPSSRADKCVQHIRKVDPYGQGRLVKQGWYRHGSMRRPNRCGGCRCDKSGP